ncbi:MAG: IS66 family transposase, partial [Thioalkalivibrio sp.]|nr:IS66 family transposase [Thioalkalivibrio sp.]
MPSDARSSSKRLPIHEAACWSHVRRNFHDIWEADHSPRAKEAIDRIGALYAIEAEIRGESPEVRRRERQARVGPLLDELKKWLDELLTQVSAKSKLGEAIGYA